MKLTPAWRNRLRNLTTIFLVLTVVAIIYTLIQWIRSEPGSFEPLNVLFFAVFSVASAVSAWLSRPDNVQPPASSEIALAETPAFGPLRQQISSLFSLEELQVLCLDIGIRYEDLSGETLSGKAASLLAYANRRGQLDQLIITLQKERPRGNWYMPETLQRQHSLRRNVQATWIDGVLNQSVAEEIALELKLTVQPHILTRKLMYVPGQENSPTEKNISTLFEQYGSLLILGEPGSGKTMALLQLAEKLLADATHDPLVPIPVIFNLSSWAIEQKPLKEWILEELWLQYQLTQESGEILVHNNRLSYLLDGLDEIPESARNNCIEALNEFKAKYVSGLVLCSRTKEYKALAQRVNVGMAVQIEPLTERQVEAYLTRPELKLDTIYQLWLNNDSLKRLAQTPLFLSIITLAYRDLTPTDLETLNTQERWKDHIYSFYITEMFRRRSLDRKRPYDESMSLNWLKHIARSMKNSNQTIFYLERIQPNWLLTNRSHLLYSSLSTFFILSVFGTFLGLVIDLRISLGFAILVWSAMTLTNWRRVQEKHKLFWDPIQIIEKLHFSRPKFIQIRQVIGKNIKFAAILSIGTGLLIGISIKPLLGIILGSITGLFIGFIFHFRSLYTKSLSSNESESKSYAFGFLLGSLIIGGAVGGLIGLIGSIASNLTNQPRNALAATISLFVIILFVPIIREFVQIQEQDKVPTPNEGIRNCLKNGILMGVVYAVFIGFIGTLIDFLSNNQLGGMLEGSALGFTVGYFVYGGKAVTEHFILRLQLARQKVLPPLNPSLRNPNQTIIEFMDDMKDRIILRRVGGGWIFIHRTLLDYFASLHPNAKIEVDHE